ncbi:MAG: plastocyanin/azurin family copper-binding protein [Gemmatimonadota bacterium]
MRAPLRALGLGAAVLLLGACFSEEPTTGPGNGEDVIVEMTPALTFEPRHVQIRAGQTIRWRNTSNFPHTATGDPALAFNLANVRLPDGAPVWHSGDVAPGSSYARTFDVVGMYTYFCVPHESSMVGTIEVIP